MKTSKQTLILIAVITSAVGLLSWDRFKQTDHLHGTADFSRILETENPDLWLSDDQMSAFITDGNDWFNTPGSDRVPPAENVLVQRIPGDNYHLLMMAVYSYENFSQPSFTLDNEQGLINFRDDGKEYDKVAGDGVYTAKIYSDVSEFRKLALKMMQDVKNNKPEPQFVNREEVFNNNCITEPFDIQKFDKNEAVPITNIIGSSNNLIDSIRNNCIFITDLSVVEDPSRTWNSCTQTGNVDGPWTFKTIIKNLAKQTANTNPTNAELSDFVLNWLHSWQVQKVINGDTVPPRPLITTKVINPWLAKSQAAGAPAGQLDMRFAPFKLTAIVNRFDIRERAAGIPAGEGRYTFCLVDSSCTKALQMTMVIEYSIPKKNNCDTLQAWAKQWYDLKDLTLGSPAYNAALQAITDQYSLWGTSNKPSNTNLDALRTNEIEFAAEDGSKKRYEFREFGINTSPTRALVQRIVAQIPADKYNVQVDNPDVRRMVSWINANRGGINHDDYVVPDSLSGIPLLGGHAQILDTPVGVPTQPYHWNGVETRNSPARIKNTTTRHVFSRNTCTGCHAGEVQTFFTHVDPVFYGTETTLSGFLSGKAGRGGAVDWDNNPNNDSMAIKDAAGRGGALNSVRIFNDILRRAKDLKDFVLSPPCAGTALSIRNELMFKPIHSVH